MGARKLFMQCLVLDVDPEDRAVVRVSPGIPVVNDAESSYVFET